MFIKTTYIVIFEESAKIEKNNKKFLDEKIEIFNNFHMKEGVNYGKNEDLCILQGINR